MEQLAKIEQTLPSINEIGNIVINYSDYDKPIDAIPIELGNGRIYLLTNIRSTDSNSRLILQDLNGNTIKELMNFGYENGEVTVDNDNIYVFTSNTYNPMFYIIDKRTLKLRYEKPLGKSRIQSVCCNEKEIFTFDMDNGEVQRRDKEGNILSVINIVKKLYDSSVSSHTDEISTIEMNNTEIQRRGKEEDDFSANDIPNTDNYYPIESQTNETSTFDKDKANIQLRDKEGNHHSNVTKRDKGYYLTSHTNVYSASDGFHYAILGEFGIDDRFRRECEEKFGKEFMDLNGYMENIAFDESSQTLFVAARNIICVASKSEIKGVMYFPDKSIMGLSVDTKTNSLVISSNNWPETDKCCSFDKGGSLEILPISMVLDRIKKSEAFLIARNLNKKVIDLCHRIVDESNGDIDQMILLLQELKNKETSSDLPAIEDKNMSDSCHPNRHSK